MLQEMAHRLLMPDVVGCNAGISANMTLSPSFQMGTYTSQCDFSNKALVLDCQNQTLDAGGGGCFFSGIVSSTGHAASKALSMAISAGGSR